MSDLSFQAVEPQPAVVGVIRSDDGRILLGRRNPELRFMGGYYSFPGGRIEAEDNDGLPPTVDRPIKTDITALVRELFEETGILFVEGNLPSAEQLREARIALLNEEMDFNHYLEGHGLRIEPSRFRRCGLFVTPETGTRRFHARYYLIDGAQVGDEELLVGELVDLQWLDPGEARRRWQEKKFELAPPVASVLKQLADFPLDTALDRLRQIEPLTGDQAHMHEARIGTHVMPVRSPTLPPARHTNCVMVGEKQLYVVDPAATEDEEQERLLRHLEMQRKLEGAELQGVLLTHAHIDHIGSATLLRDRYQIPICAHELTATEVDFEVDRLLDDDETIPVHGGWQLRCLFTPGHHPGHLCFLEESSGTLIAGDMVAGRSSILIAHGHGGDMDAYLTSMRRLLEIDYDLLIPSHGQAFSDAKTTIQRQIDHRLAREAKIQAALDSGARTIEDLLITAYDDVSKKMWKWATYTLKAHLVRLGISDFDEGLGR